MVGGGDGEGGGERGGDGVRCVCCIPFGTDVCCVGTFVLNKIRPFDFFGHCRISMAWFHLLFEGTTVEYTHHFVNIYLFV